MSTISTNYKPIYIDPNAKADLRTNENETGAPVESAP
jgi:cell division protein FtsB